MQSFRQVAATPSHLKIQIVNNKKRWYLRRRNAMKGLFWK
jgi:hypothetical protein